MSDKLKLSEIYTARYNFLKERGVDSSEACADAQESVEDAIAAHIKELVDVTNSSIIGTENIAEAMFNGIYGSHRFLQNEFFQALFKMMDKYGNLEDGWFDARNGYAVATCKVMSDAQKKEW